MFRPYNSAMRVVLFCMMFSLCSFGADRTIDGFEPYVYRNAHRETMPYRLFVPRGYSSDKPYPLVIWLHGAGGAGEDNRAQISGDQISGTRTWTKPENQAKYPTFVLVPQNPANWVDRLDEMSPGIRLVLEILESVKTRYNIDAARIYVAGQSDGGYGTWNVITQRPDVFAAAIPLCGGGDPQSAVRIAAMPLWVFHGRQDAVIPVTESREMIAAIKKAGGHPRYTEYDRLGHDIWKQTFKERDIVSWLFAQHK
jgi:predicted peptidase